MYIEKKGIKLNFIHSFIRRVNPPAKDAPTSTTWPAKALGKKFEGKQKHTAMDELYYLD